MSVRVRDVLAAIFDGCAGLLELRAKSPAGMVRSFLEPGDTDTLATFVATHRDHDVWFGVATRCDRSNGTLANCQHLGALYVDVDGSQDSRVFDRIPLPPSIVIRSGGGRHGYWLLREPFDVQTEQASIYAYLRLRWRRGPVPVAAGGAREDSTTECVSVVANFS